MSGTWQDSIRRVLKISEAEIELWQKIADMVAGNYCKCIIHMMIQKERGALKMLLEMHGRERDEPYSHVRIIAGYDPGINPGMITIMVRVQTGRDTDYGPVWVSYDPLCPDYKRTWTDQAR